MPPPAGYTDFYELELKINYNNSSNPYLQYWTGAPLQPPQEKQAGWTERYLLRPATQSPLSSAPLGNAGYLIQARAALLGLNFYIKNAIVHQASVFKSSWPMPGTARYPIFDNIVNVSGSPSAQYCSSPEENFLIRCEANSLYRFEHGIRGLKDYLSDDAMSFFPATSYADSTTLETTSTFDSAQTPIPNPAFQGFAQASFTVTLANGSISAPVLVGGGGGSWPGAAAGTYPCYFYATTGYTIPALGTITLNSSGVATSATINNAFAGSGYTSTNVFVPVGNDPNGLPNYLSPSLYWANFLSCLISFVESGTTRRIAASRYTVTQPTFPSGLAPAIFGTPVSCNRAMLQRVGNRQTGQIRLTKPARRKIAR
jgi:hypothetical protein